MLDPCTINLFALPFASLEERSRFPKISCIYFAIDSQGTVQYIGRSVNLQQRWVQHHRQRQLEAMEGVRIAWLIVDAPELLPEIEAALIQWFSPLLNGYRQELGKPNKSAVIVRLKELRARKEISQNELARRLEMSLANVQKIEYNKAKSIPLDTLDRLCEVLECEVGELLVRISNAETIK